MLEVENLEVSYGALAALHGVSLAVRPGEIVALVGPNGAGKSTLLKTIAALLVPRAGVIRWEGKPLSGESPQRIVECGVALVPEGRRLFAAMTVRENLELGAFPQRAQKRRKGQLERVYSLFPRLLEREGQLAGSLSGGEQQMLALGRALMGLPRLHLDRKSTRLNSSHLGISYAVFCLKKKNMRTNKAGGSTRAALKSKAGAAKIASPPARWEAAEEGRPAADMNTEGE